MELQSMSVSRSYFEPIYGVSCDVKREVYRQSHIWPLAKNLMGLSQFGGAA